MADAPDWPKVLSLAVHEFRTPLTVVGGYLHMLSASRMGALTEAQQRVVEEAERSCRRLSELLTEVSEVAHFHQGRLTFLRGPITLSSLIENIRLPDGAGTRLLVGNGTQGTSLEGDAGRLAKALSAVAAAVAREAVETDVLHVLPSVRKSPRGRDAFIAMGSEQVAREILATSAADLPAFDITRGGSGLSLVIASQVVERHGGRLYGARGEHARAGAAVTLPLSS